MDVIVDDRRPANPAGGTDHGCAITIVMPCLNEEKALPHCIANARHALAEISRLFSLTGEIVIADNGSTDGSASLARRMGARVVPVADRGYGNTLIGGVRAAHGRYIVMGDCDGSYDFRDAVPMVAALLDGYDFCNGTRLRGRILPGAMPLKNRYLGNPVLSGILNLLFRSGLSDAHCGLLAFTRSAFDRLQIDSEGMELASEMVIKAALLKLRRTEVPITLHPDLRDRTPHLRPWRDGWRHLRYILMLAPEWLFLGPAAVFGILALVSLTAILGGTEQAPFRMLGITFGDHWIVIGCMAAVLCHLLVLFGIVGIVHGLRSRYRRPPWFWSHLAEVVTLERSLILGSAAIVAGLWIIGAVAWDWIKIRFTNPHEIRAMVAACTLVIIGSQHLFGGFLLSIIGGNRARLQDLPQA